MSEATTSAGQGIADPARRDPDKAAMIFGDAVRTYGELDRRVNQIAHALRRAGVAEGDRVAVALFNSFEWFEVLNALGRLGALLVPVSFRGKGPEIAYALDDSAPSALLIDGERLERIRPQLPQLNLRALIVARRETAGPDGTDFAAAVSGAATDLPPADIAPSDDCTILYTSGTTGKPKGAVATQRNHVTNIMNSLLAGAVARGLLGDVSAPPPDAPQPAVLQTFPFFHIGGLSGLYVGTAIGAKMALMHKWNPAEAVRLVARHRLMSVSGVPIVVRQLLEAEDLRATAVTAGELSVALTDPPDAFLDVAQKALRLDIGTVQLRNVIHPAKT